MISVIVLFIFSDVMTKLNTDEWQYQFLGVTLFTVVLNGTMTAIFQVSCIFILPLKGSPGTMAVRVVEFLNEVYTLQMLTDKRQTN